MTVLIIFVLLIFKTRGVLSLFLPSFLPFRCFHAFSLSGVVIGVAAASVWLLAFMGRLHMSARTASFVNVTLNVARAGTETRPALFGSLNCMFSRKPVLILRWWSRKTVVS